MALRSQLFRGDAALEAAATSDAAHIVPGARGEHVRKIQIALVQLDGATIDTDGIYGPGTAAAVLAYKQARDIINRSYQTQADNIVGRMTMAALDSEMFANDGPTPPTPPAPLRDRTGIDCGNSAAVPVAAIQIHRPAALVRASSTSFTASPPLSIFGATPKLRRLTTAEEAIARGVYGSSIDFSIVFISDQFGLGNLPFTVGTPIVTRQIMNLGPAAFAGTPDTATLIHELAHVWQSQHDIDGTEFMTASVSGQAAARTANEALALIDPTLKRNQFPNHFPFSTYAYLRGKRFSQYGAEQIANSVEHGEPAIVAHVRSVGPGVFDDANHRSLGLGAMMEDRRDPNVVF